MFSVFQPPSSTTSNDDHRDFYDADTRFPIWDAKVERLGSYYLAIARAIATLNSSDGMPVGLDMGETVEPLRDYCTRTNTPADAIDGVERQFSDHVAGKVAAVIRRTKVDRYARFPWAVEPVPTFICGGGSRYALYRTAVHDAAQRFPIKLETLPLPVPDTLKAQGIEDELFDRMSVAYGLSFEPMEIGEIVPSHRIDDAGRRDQERPRQPPHGIDPTDRDQAE
jgi:hypothetical protein